MGVSTGQFSNDHQYINLSWKGCTFSNILKMLSCHSILRLGWGGQRKISWVYLPVYSEQRVETSWGTNQAWSVERRVARCIRCLCSLPCAATTCPKRKAWVLRFSSFYAHCRSLSRSFHGNKDSKRACMEPDSPCWMRQVVDMRQGWGQ